ncbi:MAG: hypothetical protein WCO65_01960 [bacterium]
MKAEKEARISWQIEEYSHREKTPDWYWALGIVAITGAIIAIMHHDVLFGIIIILGGFIMGYYAAREPDIIDVSINQDGITFNNHLFLFEKIKGFAVEEHTMGNKLLIETSRAVAPLISIPLPETLDTEGLHELLKTKIKEKDLHEPTAHRIIEHIGF